MLKLFARFLREDGGATSIEYALIGALVGVAIIVGAGAVGTKLGSMYQAVADKVTPPT